MKIVELEGDAFRSGKLLRKMAMQEWINRWVVEVEDRQLVVDSKYLQTDQHDELLNAMCIKISEKLLETCGTVHKESRQVKLTVLGLRRRGIE